MTTEDPLLYRFSMLASRIGRREYVISIGEQLDYVQVSEIGIPRMNGRPLQPDELLSVDRVRYGDKEFAAGRDEHGLRVYLQGAAMSLPICALEDVHDSMHLTHCLERGDYPLPHAILGLLNREEVERIYSEANRLSRSPSA